MAETVEYFVAAPGLPGAEVALLAARGALLAHRRFRNRPGYARWFQSSMAKVVLRAEDEDVTRLVRNTAEDALLLPEPPALPVMAVFRPRPRERLPFLHQLKLYSASVGALPRVTLPGEGLWLPLYLNSELSMSAGKAAAQAAHAMLAALERFGRSAAWAEWLQAGAELALLRAPEEQLRATAGRGQAAVVRDAGRTAVPSGSLTCAAGLPGEPAQWPIEGATLMALAPLRFAPTPRAAPQP